MHLSTFSATTVALGSPFRFKGGINCPLADRRGSALIGSSVDDTHTFATCVYEHAGHCIYFFPDGSFLLGARGCPTDIPRHVAHTSITVSISTSTSPDGICPPMDSNGTGLTASSAVTEEDGNFLSCTYPDAGVCKYFLNGDFSSGSSVCPNDPAAKPTSISTTLSSISASRTPMSSFISTPAFSSTLTPTSSSTSSFSSSTLHAQTGGRARVNVGAIAGGFIAGVFALLVAALIFRCWRRRLPQKAETPETRPFFTFMENETNIRVPHPYTATHSFIQSPSAGKAKMHTSSGELGGAQLTRRSEHTVDETRTTQVPLSQRLGTQKSEPSRSGGSDTAILHALESLRMEVREVRWLATEGIHPPPGYATE